MANSLIQIKNSTVNNTPDDGDLIRAELGYSFTANTLYIGGPDGVGVIPIGGRSQVDKLQAAFETANAATSGGDPAAFAKANLAYTFAANNAMLTANSAYDKANAANILAFDTDTKVIAAYTRANAGMLTANTAYDKANAANILAFNALPKTGGTISGDLVVQGNVTFSGNTTFTNTQHLLIGDNLLTLNADLPSDVAPADNSGIEVNRGSSANVAIIWNESTDSWTFTVDGTSYSTIPTNTAVETAQTKGQAAHLTANTAYGAANTTWTYAANSVMLVANSAYIHANAAMLTANAAYDKANSANINAADASFLTTGTVDSARISGSYTGITGVGTIVTGVWQGTNVHVGYGGTGRLSFTNNGVLYGNNAGPINVTGAGTEGQVLMATATGVPQFSHIDGGTF